MRELLFWGLSGVLFLVATASFVLSLLVKGQEKRYLSWVVLAVWAVLCLALALVLRARFL